MRIWLILKQLSVGYCLTFTGIYCAAQPIVARTDISSVKVPIDLLKGTRLFIGLR